MFRDSACYFGSELQCRLHLYPDHRNLCAMFILQYALWAYGFMGLMGCAPRWAGGSSASGSKGGSKGKSKDDEKDDKKQAKNLQSKMLTLLKYHKEKGKDDEKKRKAETCLEKYGRLKEGKNQPLQQCSSLKEVLYRTWHGPTSFRRRRWITKMNTKRRCPTTTLRISNAP